MAKVIAVYSMKGGVGKTTIAVNLAFCSAVLAGHRTLAAPGQQSLLRSTYFDTADARLWNAGASLRIRADGDSLEQTLKLASGKHGPVRRSEWTVAASSPALAPDRLPGKARSKLLSLLAGAEPMALATSIVERETRVIRHGASAIEVAFDAGTIVSGSRETPVCELELELVQGEMTDLVALAQKLPLGPDLGWSIASKAERCLSLAFDKPPAAVRARAITLPEHVSIAEGFQRIAWNCLEQLLGNARLVIATGDADAIHQSRVAIRRLRAAFTLFGDVTHDEVSSAIRAELKAAASALGPARDMQVLRASMTAVAPDSADDTTELRAHLDHRIEEAVGTAQTSLASGEFQRLLFTIAQWIETGDWLARQGDTGADKPLHKFAQHLLARRRRQIRQRGQNLEALAPADLHKLRIAIKKLRYGTEFFGTLLDADASGNGRATRHRHAFAKALEQLQDDLGALNDMAMAASGQSLQIDDDDPLVAARLTAQLDALIEQQAVSRRKLLKSASKAFDRVAEGPAWWKAAKT